VCDLETSRMGAPYIYDISHLRVNELTNAKNLVLHSSHFAVNLRCCTAVR